MKLLITQFNSPDATEKAYPLNSLEDFQSIVEHFPALKESLYKHKDLSHVAEDMAAYLNLSSLISARVERS